mmetsp:Transcript_83482/g.270068  ORF Transcript_83482/g.270068 Transcript_83482/m.270068 type:complete len:249 (-) Transcript_83482:1903-2649(-)
MPSTLGPRLQSLPDLVRGRLPLRLQLLQACPEAALVPGGLVDQLAHLVTSPPPFRAQLADVAELLGSCGRGGPDGLRSLPGPLLRRRDGATLYVHALGPLGGHVCYFAAKLYIALLSVCGGVCGSSCKLCSAIEATTDALHARVELRTEATQLAGQQAGDGIQCTPAPLLLSSLQSGSLAAALGQFGLCGLQSAAQGSHVRLEALSLLPEQLNGILLCGTLLLQLRHLAGDVPSSGSKLLDGRCQSRG